MVNIESAYDRIVRGDPPWFTELLSTLQGEDGLENLGLGAVTWDNSLTYLYAYKDEIIERFNEYFALYEIGQETPQRFQFMCDRHYSANKRKWNYRIELYTNNLTTQLGRLNETIKVSEILKAITGQDTESKTGQDIVTGVHGNKQAYATSKETKNYNTPVTQVTSLNDGYLTGGSGEDNTTGVEGENSINDTTQTERKGIYESNKQDNTSEDVTTTYKFYDKPIVELIEENIGIWNDIIQSIINDCKELFINVIARI